MRIIKEKQQSPYIRQYSCMHQATKTCISGWAFQLEIRMKFIQLVEEDEAVTIGEIHKNETRMGT